MQRGVRTDDEDHLLPVSKQFFQFQAFERVVFLVHLCPAPNVFAAGDSTR